MIMAVEFIHNMHVRSFYYHIKLVNATLPRLKSSLDRKNIPQSISIYITRISDLMIRKNCNKVNKILWFSRLKLKVNSADFLYFCK